MMLQVQDLGNSSYKRTWELQKELQLQRIEQDNASREEIDFDLYMIFNPRNLQTAQTHLQICQILSLIHI